VFERSGRHLLRLLPRVLMCQGVVAYLYVTLKQNKKAAAECEKVSLCLVYLLPYL